MPLLTMKQIMADSVKLATTDVDPKERYAVGAFQYHSGDGWHRRGCP